MARTPTPVGPPPPPVDQSDRRDRLERARDRLAEEIENASARDLAPLVGRYQSVLADLAEIAAEDVRESDDLDDLSAARARRRATPPGL